MDPLTQMGQMDPKRPLHRLRPMVLKDRLVLKDRSIRRGLKVRLLRLHPWHLLLR